MGQRWSWPFWSSGKYTQEVPLRGQPEPEKDPYGLEANLHTHVICQKNPGHHKFIPVRDFDMQHLPEKYRDRRILEAIKAGSENCVHIKATEISKHRPKCYPGTTDPYPFHISEGGSRVRTGSGYVWYLYKCGKGGDFDHHTICFCEKCLTSPSPKKNYWRVGIVTAAHIVCDEEEVRDIEITFNFDSGDNGSAITTKASRFCNSVIDGDVCFLEVPVHDDKLGLRLKEASDCYYKNRKLVDWRDLVVVASHPHGLSKHITVGERVRMGQLPNGRECCVYTTSTCPGSSGGLVMGGRESWEVGRCLYWRAGTHSEALRDGTNRSGWIWWLF